MRSQEKEQDRSRDTLEQKPPSLRVPVQDVSSVATGSTGRSCISASRALKPPERNAAVKDLGACERCLEIRDDLAFCKSTFLCRHPDCKAGCGPEHHHYLCPNADTESSAVQKRGGRHPGEGKQEYTADQEDYIRNLPRTRKTVPGCLLERRLKNPQRSDQAIKPSH